MAWAIDDKEPELWTPGQPFPSVLESALSPILLPASFHAWNAQFEIEIWKHCSPSDWPGIPLEVWYDTMGDAAMCGFPLKLDKCSKALGVANKGAEGTQLINKLSKPKVDGTFWQYKDCPEDFEAMYEYCLQDVRVEREVFGALPAHVEGPEMELQKLTWLSNDRGVPIDVESVEVLQKRIAEHIEYVDHQFQKITEGLLDSPRQRDALLRHLEMNRVAASKHLDMRAARAASGLTNPRLLTKDIPGITLDNLRGDETEKVLKEWSISSYDRKLIELQRDINHSSVAKFKKILVQLCKDRTVKDNVQYHGAATGRDAARGFQIQNLPRDTETNPEELLEWFYKYPASTLDLVFPVLEKASTLIRPMIQAPAGKKLVVSDFGQVEARGAAWTCKEDSILQNFREGIDPYEAQAANMYHVELDDVTKKQRNYGKLSVLACGYQGSHTALTKFAEGYGLTIERKEAAKVVGKFRQARPKLVAAWAAFADAALHAVEDAGTPYQVEGCQHAVFKMQGRHLTMELPSGRKLWYPYARTDQVTTNYIDADTGKEKSFTLKSVTAMHMKNVWCRRGMSGGNFFQNYVQAICRDILMEAVVRVEEAGYPIVGRIHDEVICLCPDDPRYTITGLNRLMCIVPGWATDFPIAADGYESNRYRK